jgi:ribonuclease Y
VAFLCSLLASELGLDPDIAKRCGLFHDIGKAINHEYEGSHASSASRLLQRHGEDPIVVNAVACSHDEVEATSVYAGLLKVADSLSATRPGVRTDSMDGYVQRVKALEDIALSFEGVAEAYAVQAGREIRVIVCPDQVDDMAARSLVRTIRQRIEDELQYPGSIKITLVREQRFTDTAK